MLYIQFCILIILTGVYMSEPIMRLKFLFFGNCYVDVYIYVFIFYLWHQIINGQFTGTCSTWGENRKLSNPSSRYKHRFWRHNKSSACSTGMMPACCTIIYYRIRMWSNNRVTYTWHHQAAGNQAMGGGGPHVMGNRNVPRPMQMVGMQRMQQQQNMSAYNLASQAGMVNPGNIPMQQQQQQRGVAAQPQHQQVSYLYIYFVFDYLSSCSSFFAILWRGCFLWNQLRRKDGLNMPGYPQQKSRRFWGKSSDMNHNTRMTLCFSKSTCSFPQDMQLFSVWNVP